MWKRLQGHVRDKEKHGQIGKPVLLESTYDQDQLRRCTNIDGAHLAGNPLPSSRVSNVPTISESSVYSRPSHDLSYYMENYTTTTTTSTSPYADVSPPSSPEPDRHLPTPATGQLKRFPSMRDVSPMDDNRKQLAPDSRAVSNIPVLRKAPAALHNGDSPAAPKQKFWEGKLAPNTKVKWDDYSGEPSSAGKSASVSPASYAQPAPVDVLPMGYTATISGPEKKSASLAERMARFGSKPAAAIEPWSRTTGRSELAPALKDDLTAKSLSLPRVRRAISPASRRTDADRSHAQGNGVVAPFDTANADLPNNPFKPTLPLKSSRKASQPSRTLTTSSSLLDLKFQPLSDPSPLFQQSDPSPDAVLGASSGDTLLSFQGTATPPYTTAEMMDKTSTPMAETGTENLTSRFSFTTYNSTTTYQHSPPPSPPPPLPLSAPLSKQRVVTEPTAAAAAAAAAAAPSILSRRRPVPHADAYLDPTPPARNLTPSPTPTSPGTATIHSPSAPASSSPNPNSPSSSAAAAAKALPQPPTTLDAPDHLAVLESQLEDLRIRRANVHRLLSDLANAAPANPLLTDFKRARLADQQKRAFEDELAEIKRQEHDVGMRIHRAWKKRERDLGATGSALWVRRVTS